MKKRAIYITLAFGLSIAVIVIVSLVAYNRLENLMHYSQQVEHSYQVQLRVSDMFVSLRSAVSSQRGYLLSGDTIYLRNYKNHQVTTYNKFRQADSLVADNSVQKQNLDTLRQLLDRRFEVVDRMLVAYEQSAGNNSVFRTDLEQDKISTVQLLRKINDIRLEEEKLMRGRISYKNASEQLVPVVLLVLIILAVLLVSLSFIFLRKELVRRFAVQQQLEEKIDALNNSNRELEQFAYVASHDLQEPLRKIMAFGTMLKVKQKDRLDEEGNYLLDTMTKISHRMKTLIDDLLTFSRMVNTDDALSYTDLNQVLQQVTDDLSEVIAQHQATVSYSQLPVVLAYPSQMHQLFQNMLTNSLKYSRAGVSPVITITASLALAREISKHLQSSGLPEKKFHRIEIKDNGIGFEQKYADQIFTIFQRLHTKDSYSGTGVGLAICKRIVTKHSGYIQATASPDKGATFSIFLPVIEEKS
jgi:signal transduction histidine kinase